MTVAFKKHVIQTKLFILKNLESAKLKRAHRYPLDLTSLNLDNAGDKARHFLDIICIIGV